MPGRTQPPVHGSAVFAIASDSPQIMFRQAITSPMFASTPRNARAPVISVALIRRPVMKSSFTASRVQPWMRARGRNPVRGKKLFAFSTSPCTNTSSQGTNTLSITKIASFSSSRLESG
jgi:hypothetical protein